MIMLLLFHITIAFGSMAYTAYTYVVPTKKKIFAARMMALATLASGTALLVLNPTKLIQACIIGSIYLAIVSIGIAFAERKLAKETAADN